MRRLLICGDRFWTDYQSILRCIKKAEKTEHIDMLIEGECRGADKLGRRAAEEIGLSIDAGSILPFPADWERYQLGAGPIRNQQMLDEGKPTEVWAFHNRLDQSTGTRDMVRRALKAGLTVWHITDHTFRKLSENKLLP